MKAIYHVSPTHLELAKSMRFTHVNIKMESFKKSIEAVDVFKKVHDLGLHTILSMDWYNVSSVQINDVISQVEPCEKCFIELHDEPNRTKVLREELLNWKEFYKIHGFRTLTVLSWIKSYRGYENISDWIGFNYYKPIDFWKELELKFKFWWFNLKNRSHIFIVPPVNETIYKTAEFWKSLGYKDFYWYQWNPQQDNIYDKSVDQSKWLQEALYWVNDNE